MTELLRYYFDEHIDPTIATQLRARGLDVMTAGEAGRSGQSITDVDQLAYAALHGRVMVTKDRDFAALAVTQVPHAGVILL